MEIRGKRKSLNDLRKNRSIMQGKVLSNQALKEKQQMLEESIYNERCSRGITSSAVAGGG